MDARSLLVDCEEELRVRKMLRARLPWWRRWTDTIREKIGYPRRYDPAEREALSEEIRRYDGEGWKDEVRVGDRRFYTPIHEFGRPPVDTGSLRASVRVAPKKRRKPAGKKATRKAKARPKKRRSR